MHTIQNHPGYIGAFTRAQVPGALPNGTRVVKQNSEPGDAVADGSLGTVLGSMRGLPSDMLAYFIEWDARPKIAIGIIEIKLRPMRYVVLRNLQTGQRFYTTNVPTEDQTRLADGALAYGIVGYRDTSYEAQDLLYNWAALEH